MLQVAAPCRAASFPCSSGSSETSQGSSPSRDVEERLLQEDAAELNKDQGAQGGGDGPLLVAAARTAVELKAAIEAGTQHIVIKNHLDLTSLEAVDDGFGNRVTLPALPPTVKSITVRSPHHLRFVRSLLFECLMSQYAIFEETHRVDRKITFISLESA